MDRPEKEMDASALAGFQIAEDDGSVYSEKNGRVSHYAPGSLVRPLSSIENFFAVGGFYKNMNTVQAVWLQSQKPFDYRTVEEALLILSRQVSILQFCLAKRGFRLWFRRMKHLSMDFEESAENPYKVYQDLLSKPYDMYEGPLWRVRLVLTEPNADVNETKPYTAVLIFSAHHCITDGTTNMRLCREILHILNNLVADRPVRPTFKAISPVFEEASESLPSINFLAKYLCRKLTATLVKNFSKKSSFSGTFPIPKTKAAGTRVLFSNLSTEETQKLLKQCKAERVTVHSCITNATNFALLKTASSRSDFDIGKPSISFTHCVNMRRYFNKDHKDVAGCHISFVEQKAKYSNSEASDFWSVTRGVQADLKERLEESEIPAKLVPLLQLASLMFIINCSLTKKGRQNRTDCHYVTTNMGNLKELLPDAGAEDQIEIIDLLRSVDCPLAGNPFLLTFHTFRNRFMLSMDYFTNKMTDEVAKEVFKTLHTYIKRLANTGSILDDVIISP